jgi:hypothetical protein
MCHRAARREPLEAFHAHPEVLRAQVRVPHRHGDIGVAEDVFQV